MATKDSWRQETASSPAPTHNGQPPNSDRNLIQANKKQDDNLMIAPCFMDDLWIRRFFKFYYESCSLSAPLHCLTQIDTGFLQPTFIADSQPSNFFLRLSSMEKGKSNKTLIFTGGKSTIPNEPTDHIASKDRNLSKTTPITSTLLPLILQK